MEEKNFTKTRQLKIIFYFEGWREKEFNDFATSSTTLIGNIVKHTLDDVKVIERAGS